jgi:Predicted hydrolases or acyltransferases (alpha/beta hydrolase superfamily)
MALFISLLLLMPAPSPAPDTLPHYPEDVETTTVDGRQIAFVDRGSGPPLLFVHGLGSNLALWRGTMDAFDDSHRVLALDLPGYGLSGKKDVPATMSFFADVVTGFLDERGLDSVTYVGVSMGGQVGLTMALRHPDRLARLALVSPAGIESFSEQEAEALRSTSTPEAIAQTSNAEVKQNAAANFDTWSNEYAWLVEQRHALAERDDFMGYAEANAAAVAGMLDGEARDRLGEVLTPTLVLFGAGDKLIPNPYLHPDQTTADVAAQARERLPNAEVELIDDAGHLLMLERPAHFHEKLRTFLNSRGEEK